MGTMVTIEIRTDPKADRKPTQDQLQQAVLAAFDRMEQVAAQTNRFEATGSADCQKVAAAAGTGRWTPVGEDLFELTDRVQEKGNPLVDLTLGPVIDVWDKARESETPPDPKAVAAALSLTGMDKVALSREIPAGAAGEQAPYGGSILLEESGMAMDFGAVAKGYAVEKAWESLTASGLPIYGIINAGGNIKPLGQKPDGTLWKIGITNPTDKTRSMGNLLMRPGEAVATSGDYQKYFEADGVRYHHLLEPATGYPGMYNHAALIVAADGFDTDYYSTLLFLLPPEEALALAENIPEIETVIISRDNKIYVSSGLKDRIEWTYQGGFSIVTP
jgi:thiamine biosynthesis lipoprotein